MREKFGNKRFRNLFWFGIATVIFIAMIWAADPNKILSALQEASLFYVFLAVLSGFLVIHAWSLNWYNFFRSLDVNCSYIRTFQLFSAGQFFNCITPLGRFGGQPVMAYLISKNSKSSYEKALATVMSADLMSLFPLSVFVLTGYLYLVLTGAVNGHIGQMSLMISSLLFIGMLAGYLAWFRSETMEKYFLGSAAKLTDFTGLGGSYIEKLGEKVGNWKDTLERIGNDPKVLIFSLIITTSAFVFRMAAFYFVLASLGLHMNPLHIMLLIPLISVANISPTPGGAGTYEAAMAGTVILLLDVSFATALTVTLLYRLATYWQALIIGYISTSTIEKMPTTYQKRRN